MCHSMSQFRCNRACRLCHRHRDRSGLSVAAEWADLRIIRLWRIDAWNGLQFKPGTSGGSSPWTFQWVCLTCSRTFRVEDVPPLPDLSCPLSQIDIHGSGHGDKRGPTCVHFVQMFGHSSRSTGRRFGSRVDLCAVCLHCMVGMHAPSADLARGLSLGYFVPSSHSDASVGDYPQHSCLDNWSSCSSLRVPKPVLVSQRR